MNTPSRACVAADLARRVVVAVVCAACVASSRTTTAVAAEQPVRVVPQVGWHEQGIASPDGSLFVSGMREFDARSVRLVSKDGTLLWSLPLAHPYHAAFSSDGRRLAVTGSDSGLLLDLRTCELRYFREFGAALVAFTPDGQKILIARGKPSFHPQPGEGGPAGRRVDRLYARR